MTLHELNHFDSVANSNASSAQIVSECRWTKTVLDISIAMYLRIADNCAVCSDCVLCGAPAIDGMLVCLLHAAQATSASALID